MNLFQQLRRNETKTKWIMALFFIVVVLFGNFIGFICSLFSEQAQETGEPTYNILTIVISSLISVAVVSIYMWIVLGRSINIIMAMNHGTEIHDRKDCPTLWDAVTNMALAASLPRPRIFIINDLSPNAFSTGNNPKQSAIGATTGLLESMDKYEIEGVVGHEMSHIKDHDTKVETVGIALTSIFAFIGGLLWHLLWDISWFPIGNDDDDNDNNNDSSLPVLIAIGFAIMMVSWVCCGISYLTQMALSRNREYLADAGSVNLTRNPKEIINALKSLEQRPSMKEANPSSNALYIVNPHKPKHSWSIANLFDTHPPLDKRIKRLEQM